MRRIQLGLTGWAANRRRGVRLVRWIGVIAVVTAVGACSSSKPASQGVGGENPQAGMNEGNLAGAGSLEKFQHGSLAGGGSGGPLTDIHFDYDDYTIRSQDGEILRTNAHWLTDHGSSHVQVEGHTDERGSEEYNLALGAKRAQAAKDYLTTLGVSADRISTISYGKELPLCTEHTEDCWTENRRDHFVVSQAGQ